MKRTYKAGLLALLVVVAIAIAGWLLRPSTSGRAVASSGPPIRAAAAGSSARARLPPSRPEPPEAEEPLRSEPTVHEETEEDAVIDEPSEDTLAEAFKECRSLARPTSLGRFEVAITYVGGEAGEGNVVQEVIVTSGRQNPVLDGVEAAGPSDAPGVVQHPEMSKCVRESVDVTTYQSKAPGESQFMLMGVRAPPTNPELPVLEASVEIPDPQAAVDAFGLSPSEPANDDAVVVIECGDYRCPMCRLAGTVLADLQREYGSKLAVYWLNNPLPIRDHAVTAALAAIAAGKQDQAWALHARLLEDEEVPTPARVRTLAEQLELDLERFEADLDDPNTAVELATQMQTCKGAGATGTPSFFIDGDLVVGAKTEAMLVEIIEEALAVQ